MSIKRIAIVGTAPSWKACPWNDPTLFIVSLNDAYSLGLPRVDAWFDQHPFSHMYFRPANQRVINAAEIPAGFYVRPEGHLEQLRAMAKTIPVFLQDHPPAGWPANAQRFPIEEYTKKYGSWWASGPSYMVAWAIEQGCEELHIYGIHLSTEQEYRDQADNFCHFLGIARGKGIRIVMAEESPLLKSKWQYAYEPRPALHPAKVKLMSVREAKARLIPQIAMLPRFANKAPKLDRLRRLEAMEADCARALQQRSRPVITAHDFGGV